MNVSSRFDHYAAGLAIFSMFFGAGNIIFPLALGFHSLDKFPYALAAFLLTAVAMPFIGLFAMFFYQGQIRSFFGRLGKIPGLCLACVIIALLGPFGSAPRCLALAYSTLSMSLPNLSLVSFSAIACVLIFLFVFKKTKLLSLMGYVLSPFKVTLLIAIVCVGFFDASASSSISTDGSNVEHFFHGLKEGYNTMDLLAAFFFAPVILTSLTQREGGSQRDFRRFLLKASGIGAVLLAAVYIGFCYISYLYAPELKGISSDRLLAAIAIKILGPKAGLVVGLTVAVSCLTTAIALIAAFTHFVHKEIFSEKISYISIIFCSLLLTFFVTTLEFQGIAKFLSPILEIFYPILIALTFYNLIKRKTLPLES
jgi:LIVCS family branched-chain amino acid:cation transporter